MSLILAPLLWCFWLYSQNQRQSALVSQSQSGVAVVAGAQNTATLLAVVAGDAPRFVLLRLDCPAGKISLYTVPEMSVLTTPNGQAFLQDSYTAAGPARAKTLLGQTIGAEPDFYLAATEEGWAALLGQRSARVNTVNLLSSEQRLLAGLSDPVAELPAGGCEAFISAAGDTPLLAQQLRAAVWEAFVRQNWDALPTLPQAVRDNSATLLTDLSAVDLLKLEDTLSYLAGREPQLTYGVLPGGFTRGGLRYEFDQDTLQLAAELLA